MQNNSDSINLNKQYDVNSSLNLSSFVYEPHSLYLNKDIFNRLAFYYDYVFY